MTRNQKIALGCGGAGCLGLLVVAIAGGLIYYFWAGYRDATDRAERANRNYNFNVNLSESNSNSNANDNTSENVVDAARWVMWPATGMLVVGLALEVRKDADPVRASQTEEAVHVEEVDELLIVDELLLAAGQPLGALFRDRLLAGHVLGAAAEQDVRAAAGHVRGDRDPALAPRLGHDHRFLLVVLRVQHMVLHAATVQQPGQLLGLLDRDRADQRTCVPDCPRADARCRSAQLRSVRRQQQPDSLDGSDGQRPADKQHRLPPRRRVPNQPVPNRLARDRYRDWRLSPEPSPREDRAGEYLWIPSGLRGYSLSASAPEP